jgi:glucose-1-phosphate cytidylyltransferase
MDCLIFCGGFGTRMNNGQPGELKPLIKVAGREILRHIISIYEHYGIRDFILLGGYRIHDLHDFASRYTNDTLRIRVLDTGEGTPTGGRLLQARDVISAGPFLLTYGDSLTNFNLDKCLDFKARTKADLVVSSYRKYVEYGILDIDEHARLGGIFEKTYSVPINAGFYILDHRIFPFIQSENDSFEINVLPKILADKNIVTNVFNIDFWHPMDTPDDQKKLDRILETNKQILFE